MPTLKKILVVDDDAGIQEAVKAILEFGNYDVTIASDGLEAISLAAHNPPNLILLDLLLSGKDGKEIAKRLRANKKTKHIPIIMLSAHPEAIKASKEGGADDFIAKPFDMSVLLEKIGKYI
jgi:DNA-binding response OmpR family regulator